MTRFPALTWPLMSLAFPAMGCIAAFYLVGAAAAAIADATFAETPPGDTSEHSDAERVAQPDRRFERQA